MSTATNGIALEGQSGLNAPGATGLSYQDAAAGAPIALRHVSSGPTGNGAGNGNGPRLNDDPAGRVALTYERNGAAVWVDDDRPPITVDGVILEVTEAGAWYVGPGRRGVMRVCEHCGRDYEARRSTSRYCSTRCRGLAWQSARGGF